MYSVVLLCVFTFLVPCCDVRYDDHINTMLGSSLRYLCSIVYTNVVFYCCFSSSRVPYMLSVSIGCPFLIVPSVLSNLYIWEYVCISRNNI